MKRGFTLVEILVVIVIITLISGISVMAFNASKKQADDAAASSLASIVGSAAEKYYSTNNEYPVPNMITGTQSDWTGPQTDYSITSTQLGIPIATLSTSKNKLVICHTACLGANLNKQYVYYLTKYGSGDTSAYTYTFTNTVGSCTYTMPSPETGGTAYIIATWSSQDGKWNVSKSIRGVVNTSDATNCPFKTL